jgi:hypothetical protein
MTPPRFLFNIDGAHLMYVAPPVSLDQFLHEILGITEGTQVDGYVHHMFTFGDAVPLFRCDVASAEPVMPEKLASGHVWRYLRNRTSLVESDPDPWEAVIAGAHDRGKTFWGSMRFNDGHPPEYGPRSRFGMENPECFVDDDCAAEVHSPGPDGKVEKCRHLNYALPEVRQHRKDLIADLCSRYDLDGFELDFTRDNYHNFTKTDVDRAADILTEYMRELHELLVGIGEQRGRPIGFGVRIPGTLEVCLQSGFDIETWVNDDLVTSLTPTVYYDTTCELPFDTFVDLTAGKAITVYASVTEGVGPGRYRPPPIKAVRAAFSNAWTHGIDGISLFNFQHHQMTNRPEDMAILSECGDPATLARKDKLYMLAGIGVANQSRFFGMENLSWHRHQLPVDVPVEPDGPGVTVTVPISDDIAAARRDRVLASITMRLDLLHFTTAEKITLQVNGIEVPMSAAKWGVSYQYAFNWNGMHGDWEASFDLTDGDWIRQGDNDITLILHQRPDDIILPFTLYTLRLEINYNILPMGLRRG